MFDVSSVLFSLLCFIFFAVFDRFELLRNVDARQMALNVNLPENMKGRTPSWGKQLVLFWAQVVFEGKSSMYRAFWGGRVRLYKLCLASLLNKKNPSKFFFARKISIK